MYSLVFLIEFPLTSTGYKTTYAVPLTPIQSIARWNGVQCCRALCTKSHCGANIPSMANSLNLCQYELYCCTMTNKCDVLMNHYFCK
uniref:Uncharacterized protein n=1 Tax=Pyxicephalus adspersus TaxID=30357 RepID=A0AAV3AEU2_PYXAD|nr:TPA: hypothetical protein GDO54_009863 [Pyxicephalus adspersus]